MAGGTPGLGFKSTMTMCKEATYATRSTSNPKRFEIMNCNIAPNRGTIDDPSLNNSVSRRALVPGGLIYKGTFRVRANYEGLEELFRAAFGSYTRVAAGTETAVFDHVFSEGANLSSYSIEVVEGDIGAGLCQVYLGAQVSRLTIRGAAGQSSDGMFVVECEVVAKDCTIGASPTTATAPAVFPVTFDDSTASTTDGYTSAADMFIKDIEVSLVNPLAEDRFYLGSLTPQRPVRNNFLDVTWKITEEFQSTALHAGLRAGSLVQLILELQDAAIIGTAAKRTLQLKSPKALMIDYQNAVDGYTVMTAVSTYRAQYDSGQGSALQALFRNGLAALP